MEPTLDLATTEQICAELRKRNGEFAFLVLESHPEGDSFVAYSGQDIDRGIYLLRLAAEYLEAIKNNLI